MSEYTDQAWKFLRDTSTGFHIKFEEHGPYFEDDKESRDIYRFMFRRAGRSFSGRFGQSINGTENGQVPTPYDILTSVTKSDPGTFENFCGDFGYDTDSRRAEKTYKAVVKEWKKVEQMFGDVLERLQEIQ